MNTESERQDYYEKSNSDIVVELGRRFRNYRLALRMTQAEIAEQSGVSVMTVVRFENGDKSAIRLDNFISLMRSIQKLENISECIPEIPASLYDMPAGKSSQRVRKHGYEK